MWLRAFMGLLSVFTLCSKILIRAGQKINYTSIKATKHKMACDEMEVLFISLKIYLYDGVRKKETFQQAAHVSTNISRQVFLLRILNKEK